MKVDFVNESKKGYVRIDDRKYEMPVQVEDILVLDEKIIVMLGKGLTHLTRPHANSNVICLDANGKRLWEIEHRDPLYEEAKGGRWNEFGKIVQLPGEVKRFKAWGGDFWVIVDTDTGKWLEYQFTK